jgi:SAM-dependent methyltransferase
MTPPDRDVVRPADVATRSGARMPQTIEKRLSTPRPGDRRSAPPAARPSDSDPEYVPFGNMESRNGLQERIEIPLLLWALRLPRGGRVLEVGCGRGIALPVLAQRLQPALLVGVDIDGALVEVARRRIVRSGTRAEVRTADVRALPFESGTFDLVIDFGTCYHVAGGSTGRSTALKEIARVLRVGGLLVHETRVAQHLAHPIRSLGHRLPWAEASTLAKERQAVLWTTRRRVDHTVL